MITILYEQRGEVITILWTNRWGDNYTIYDEVITILYKRWSGIFNGSYLSIYIHVIIVNMHRWQVMWGGLKNIYIILASEANVAPNKLFMKGVVNECYYKY